MVRTVPPAPFPRIYSCLPGLFAEDTAGCSTLPYPDRFLRWSICCIFTGSCNRSIACCWDGQSRYKTVAEKRMTALILIEQSPQTSISGIWGSWIAGWRWRIAARARMRLRNQDAGTPMAVNIMLDTDCVALIHGAPGGLGRQRYGEHPGYMIWEVHVAGLPGWKPHYRFSSGTSSGNIS
jgi:hypothetical protein